MAKQLTIKAKSREQKTPNALRSAGQIPATVYGHSLKSVSVQVNAKEFVKIPHKAYSHINELVLDDTQEGFPVLIRNVQVEPVRSQILNVEFYRVKSDEKIKVKVSLNYIGHSPAITAGGILIVSQNEIEIQCFPKDIPDVIDVKLDSIIEIGQSISAKDLEVADTIQILTKPSEVLVKVEIPKTHEIEEAPVVAAAQEAEVQAESQPASPGKEAPPPQQTKSQEKEKPAKK